MFRSLHSLPFQIKHCIKSGIRKKCPFTISFHPSHFIPFKLTFRGCILFTLQSFILFCHLIQFSHLFSHRWSNCPTFGPNSVPRSMDTFQERKVTTLKGRGVEKAAAVDPCIFHDWFERSFTVNCKICWRGRIESINREELGMSALSEGRKWEGMEWKLKSNWLLFVSREKWLKTKFSS